MKFIVDEMLGKLAKWLRILGYDTLYISPTTDSYLVSQAFKEQRIILTRDRRLVERKYMPKYVLVKSNDYNEQLEEIRKELGLKPDPEKWFSRCLICNTEIQPVKKEEIKDKVSEFTYETHEQFYQCSSCNRIYWPGTHTKNVIGKLTNLLTPRRCK